MSTFTPSTRIRLRFTPILLPAVWTIAVLILTLVVISRFSIHTTSLIKRVHVRPEMRYEQFDGILWRHSNTYIVTASRLTCNRGECVTTINGQQLLIEPEKVGNSMGCFAYLDDVRLTCKHNSFSGNPLKQEPGVVLGAEILNAGWTANAVPQWMYTWSVFLVMTGTTALPIVWYIYMLRKRWPKMKTKPFVAKWSRVALSLVILAVVVSATYFFTVFVTLDNVGIYS